MLADHDIVGPHLAAHRLLRAGEGAGGLAVVVGGEQALGLVGLDGEDHERPAVAAVEPYAVGDGGRPRLVGVRGAAAAHRGDIVGELVQRIAMGLAGGRLAGDAQLGAPALARVGCGAHGPGGARKLAGRAQRGLDHDVAEGGDSASHSAERR